MTLANKITLMRIALVPFFMYFLYVGQKEIALVLFILASVTDFLDGYIARKYNQITDFGKFVDPLADKLLVTAAIIIFVELGKMSGVFAFIILAREFIVTSLRVVAISKGKVMAAAITGKVKTVIQILSIVVMMSNFADIAVYQDITINDMAALIMTLITIYSGIDYVKANFEIIADGARG